MIRTAFKQINIFRPSLNIIPWWMINIILQEKLHILSCFLKLVAKTLCILTYLIKMIDNSILWWIRINSYFLQKASCGSRNQKQSAFAIDSKFYTSLVFTGFFLNSSWTPGRCKRQLSWLFSRHFSGWGLVIFLFLCIPLAQLHIKDCSKIIHKPWAD